MCGKPLSPGVVPRVEALADRLARFGSEPAILRELLCPALAEAEPEAVAVVPPGARRYGGPQQMRLAVAGDGRARWDDDDPGPGVVRRRGPPMRWA